MNGTINLPRSTITAKAPGRGSIKGSFASPHFPPHVRRGAAAIKRSRPYLQGKWQEMLNDQLIQIGSNPALTGILKQDLMAAHHADHYMCVNPNARAADAWLSGLNRASVRNTPIDISENALSGGFFSPMKALAHAMSGEGTPLQVNIGNIGINPTPLNVPTLGAMIAGAQIGSSPINIDRIAYNSGIDSAIAAAYLGNITLKITGTVHKESHQNYTFTGQATAYHDTYDANVSTHRSWLAESATAVLRTIMEKEQSKSYEIVISGALPIHHTQ